MNKHIGSTLDEFIEEDNRIRTFNELMELISYDWNSQGMIKDKECYIVNKTYIEPTRVTYKTEVYNMDISVYYKVRKFYELLED